MKSNAKSKVISIVDAVAKLEQDPAIQAQLAQIKKDRAASPARHSRTFNFELIQLSMEINTRSVVLANLIMEIQRNSHAWPNQDMDLAWADRAKAIFTLAELSNEYDQLVRKLDLDIHNEDFQKSCNV